MIPHAAKIALVNYWATWGGQALNDLPVIEALQTEYADKSFAVLGVLVWDQGSEESALDFLLSNGISYPVVAYDTVPLFTQIAGMQKMGIPFTIFTMLKATRLAAYWRELVVKRIGPA